MNKRGAYFFVVDAILGGSIFLITLIIILSSYVNNPVRVQSHLIGEDTMDFMLNTKIIDFRNSYFDSLYNDGHIIDPENSIFQQITEFHYKGNNSLARNFTKHVLDLVIEEQYGYSYSINGTVIYNKSVEKIDQSNIYLTSRKITFYIANQTTIYGPEIAELRLWS